MRKGMCEIMEIIDFGVKDYGEVLEQQETLFHKLLEDKKEGRKSKEFLLLGEHLPVITMGRRAKETNLLVSEDFLSNNGVGFYHIGRGGDVTYHGPGQLILYPIIDLCAHKLGVKQYVDLLEEAVIKLLKEYGIKGERVEGATGVWIGKGTPEERKICAIGIKCSHFCTMHGIAINVSTDLRGFGLINPCGFQDKGVTSMKKELGRDIDMKEVKGKILHILLGLIFPFEEILDLLK